MRKLMGFVFGLLGKLILLGLAVLLAGLLYVGAYFYVKSGEPMTVAEAQRLAPGLTFRDFWATRVEQWRYWDRELENAGKNGGACEVPATGLTVYRAFVSVPFVLQARAAHQNDPEYDRQLRLRNNNAIPPAEILYDAPLLDAAWAEFEEGAWWSFADHPGYPGGPELNHRRMCLTIHPTPADVSANHVQGTGTLP